jgi:hypothetical protein
MRPGDAPALRAYRIRDATIAEIAVALERDVGVGDSGAEAGIDQ